MAVLPLVVAAAAGVGADLLAARIAGQRGTAGTATATALVAALLAAGMVAHVPYAWHGWLMPLWAWGWLVVADLDLRTRMVHDLHVAALAVLALVAAVLDRQALVSVAGGVVVAGLLAALNGAATVGKGRAWPVVAAAALGLALGGVAWMVMTRLTAGVPVRGAADPRVALAALAVVVPPGLTVVLRRMARGWDGELVGWGDVLLAAVMGLWFGIRWVWPPLLAGIGVAALLGAIRWIAVMLMEQRPPWLREAQPTVPGLFVGAVLGVVFAGPWR
jgi:prepilin signal peptidase PulO-like enzyme (type II secretory pathway)